MIRTYKTGFTLIELSLVLVIIGLLIGGVLAGKDLIRAAEMRQLQAEKERIVLSVNAFGLKYACLTGDCAKATEFFGDDANGCPKAYDSTFMVETCNGNGDRVFNNISGNSENELFWQHLSSAGLWPGAFRGGRVSTGSGYDKSVFDALDMADSFYWNVSCADCVNDGALFEVFTSNVLTIGEYESSGTGLMTPAEMFVFDQKYDDGLPGTGSIRVLSSAYLSNCTDPQDFPAPEAQYDLTIATPTCTPTFTNLGF